MANTPSSPKPMKAKPLFEKKKWIWIAGALLIVTTIFWPSGSSDGKSPRTSSTEKPKPVEQKVTKVVKIQLDPEKWSEWIDLYELKPPEVPDDASAKFHVGAPGWHEFWDIRSKPIFVPDKLSDEEQSQKYQGIVSSIFKLRGEEGEAVIRIEYIFSK